MAKSKILVVEDEKIVAGDIQRILEYLGYSVSALVSSGQQAIDETKKNKPDLILMDIKLKGDIDGVEAASQIRASFDIPIIFVTALSDDATLQRAKLTEPYGFIHKPIEEKELHTTIEVAFFRHKMESKLKESEEKYRALVENATDFIYMIDKNFKVLSLNKAAAALWGKKPKEIKGKSIFDLFPRELATNYSKNLKKVFKTSRPEYYESKLIAGKRELWTSVCLSPVKDPLGEVIAVMGVTRDITERRKAELEREKLRTYLIQSEKMAGLGTLAGGIAHEFNNLLQIISGYIQFAKRTKNIEDLKEAFDTILNASDRAAKIVRDLFTFSQPKTGKKERCCIADIMESVLSLTEKQMKIRNVRIIREFEKTPLLWVNRGEMQQVFLNLVFNAQDSMSNKGGELELSVNHVNGYVNVKFRDTGKGIKEEDLGKVFEPFHTTKDSVQENKQNQHTGLGLAVSYGIVKRHRGTIEVESKKNKGTTFIIRLPVKEDHPKQGLFLDNILRVFPEK